MQDRQKPDEPGIWERDIHPYLVFRDCGTK